MYKAISGLAALSLAIGAFAPQMIHAQENRNPEAVFVMTNAADRNEVISYQRTYNGNFTEAGRFATEGRGSGGAVDPLQSQGSLTFSQDHTLLFAANAGSGTISVFRVFGGQLALVQSLPSGGSEPLAIAQSGRFVFVLNGAAAGSVVSFRMGFAGLLEQIPGSTQFLSGAGAGGSSISVSPDGTRLAVVERNTNSIDTFRVQADGTLGSIVTTKSTAPGIFSASFSPAGNLFVSEVGASGAETDSAISSYSILANGTLSVVSQSVPTFGMANCWNAITPNGKSVYVSNAGSGNISGFSIGQGGTLKPIASTILGTNPAGSANLDIAISADGTLLFSLDSGTGAISIFSIQNDGTLNPAGAIEGLPKAAGFNGIAAL